MNLKATLFLASVAGISAFDIEEFSDIPALNHNGPFTGSGRCALVNIAMDESGSMQREQMFMKTYAIPRLSNLLYGAEYQYDMVFFCTNGFGSADAPASADYFRHIGCDIGVRGTSTGLPAGSDITEWENAQGGEFEDGYNAIEASIAAVPASIAGQDVYTSCASLKNNFILVTDEDRDELNSASTINTVRAAIADNNYILNEVVEVDINLSDVPGFDTSETEIGIRANYDPAKAATPLEREECVERFPLPRSCSMEEYYDISNEYFTSNLASGRLGDWQTVLTDIPPDTHITNGRGGDTMADYFPLITETRGAMWSVGVLRANIDGDLIVTDQNIVEAWAEAFVDIKVDEIDCGSNCVPCQNPPCRVTELGGDPHITTWRNEHYEYHGQCDLVMIKDPNFADGLGIDVHIRTKIVRFWSYIKSVAIRIGNDVFEIEGTGDVDDDKPHYWINYEYQGEIEEFAGFPVTLESNTNYKRIWTINLGPKYENESIMIQVYKEFVRVRFSGGKASFGKTVGLLGDYFSGKTLARDGQTVLNDFTELGQEWQVMPSEPKLFHQIEHPQFPEKCLEPEDPRGERRRRLEESGISIEEAETACKQLDDPLARKDCVYDILATQDIDMVGAF